MNAFAALADPTRRRIVELLAEHERSAGELAAHFATSRPGVSRHLRVLREHGLVRAREEGARRLYSLDPAPLAELDDWLARHRGFWADRLDTLDTEITPPPQTRHGPRGGPMTITITPYLLYADVDAALAFLARAFGFAEILRSAGADGRVNHAEASLGESRVYLGDPTSADSEYRNPAALGAATVLVVVDGVGDVDALCERARVAGAQITEEPADQDYGERRFAATDPEGHRWFFSQKIAEVAPADWGATTPDK